MIIVVSLLNSGCELIQDAGTTETSVGTPTTTPPEFVVTPGEDILGNDGSDDQNPDDSGIVIQPPIMMDEGLVLNDGDTKTKEDTIRARFVTLNRNQMRYAFGTSCTSASFVSWQPVLDLAVPQDDLNSVVSVSVQYKDYDGLLTPCYTSTIIQDNQGPNILFQIYPPHSVSEGSPGQIKFQVTDLLSEVTSVTCSLNGLQQPCLAGSNEVNITAMPVGNYRFAVNAVDDLGHESTAAILWEVVSTTRTLSQNMIVDDYKKVDVLFVIDNSGSMEYEQRSMGQRTSNFLSVLRGLNYQIAMTTTDPDSRQSWGDGKLLQITGGSSGQTLITSAQNESTAQQQLSATLQRREKGSGSEQGIRAVYRAIERYSSASTNYPFFRPSSQLAVVLISDEDESDDTSKNDPQNLVNLVRSTFGGQKRFSYHSIITRPGDTACKDTHGYAYGHRYKAMSELTGGLIGDVCQTDYAAQVQGIAQGIRDLLKTLTLQCVPLTDRPIVVSRDGVALSQTFQVEGINLKFDNELEPGAYNIVYSCLK